MIPMSNIIKNWTKQRLFQVDQFAKPCSIEYNNRQSHPSRCGGAMTIFYGTCIVWYFQYRINLLISHDRDNYISVNVQTDLETRKPLYLKDSAFDFTLQVLNKDFDNDNNPYGEFKLHMFSSMEG